MAGGTVTENVHRWPAQKDARATASAQGFTCSLKFAGSSSSRRRYRSISRRPGHQHLPPGNVREQHCVVSPSSCPGKPVRAAQ